MPSYAAPLYITMGKLFLFGWLCLAALNVFAELFSPLSFDEASQKAAKTGKLLFVDFYTTWCGPCRLMEVTTWTNDEVIRVLEEKTVPIKLDADKETKLAERFHIEGFPTMLLLKPDGTELDRFLGYRDAKTFLADFNAALKGRDPASKAKDKSASLGPNDPMARMQHGQKLAQAGKNAEALEEFLWCFDHGDEARASFDPVRLSILLEQIKELGTHYLGAMKALESRRDARQSELLSGSTNQQAAIELVRLNDALEQKQKSLEVFDRLPAGSPLRAVISDLVIDDLVEARRYADILAGKDVKSDFAKKVELYTSMSVALDQKNPVRDFTDQGYRKYTVDSGAHLFEALAGVKRNEEARELAQQILKFDASASTRKTLTDAAARAGNDDVAPLHFD